MSRTRVEDTGRISDESTEERVRQRTTEHSRGSFRDAGHRQIGIGLGLVGLLGVLGAIVIPSLRPLLIAVATTGLFGAFLSYYLTPEQFVPLPFTEDLYTAHEKLGRQLVSELGLTTRRIYCPREPENEGDLPAVRLYVPQHETDTVPEDALDSLFVVGDDPTSRGISVPSIGSQLLETFDGTVDDRVSTEPETLAEQVCETIETTFDLAREARAVEQSEPGTVTIYLEEPVYTPVERFDHPAQSFIGSAFAAQLGAPVRAEASTGDEGGAYVRCEWAQDTSREV